jgi:DNA-binding transcriptional LysR family regulator
MRSSRSINHIALMGTFVRILQAGSLSAAAKQLSTTQPTISRQLRALENYLGLQLLNRSTHGMSLTEAGRRYYEHTRGLLQDLEAFESGLRGEATSPTGLLRLVVPTAFGQGWLVELANHYLEACPLMRLEWQLSEAPVNFAEQAIDCVIRVGQPTDESAIARPLGEVRRLLAAAPSLLDRHNKIERPEDLPNLPWVALSPYYQNRIDLHDGHGNTREIAIAPRFVADHIFSTLTAARLGIGAVLISEWAVRADLANGTLIRLLPSWSGTPVPVYLIYPRTKFYSAKLRRFIEVIEASVPGFLGEEPVVRKK